MIAGRKLRILSLAAVVLASLLSLCQSTAQPPINQLFSAHSRSGQFVVQKRHANVRMPVPVLEASTNAGFVRLEPTTLAVSAERIKQRLYHHLVITGPWGSKIYLSIRPAQTTNDQVVIASERLNDGWQYGIEIPEIIDRVRFVRALTQCLLLEYANRGLPPRSAELPFWLSEGFAGTLLDSGEAEIILPAPQFSRGGKEVAAAFLNEQRENPVARLKRAFAEEPPLNFQQLSWPSAEHLRGAQAVHYRASAMLLVSELLRLPDGQACLRSMLKQLPEFQNWQFAFLRAFKSCFRRPLEIEKWWDLQAAHFAGRDLAEAWSKHESWLKLDEILGAAVEVRASSKDLPQHARMTLQSVIIDWPRAEQEPVLREKALQLNWLRLRVAPELTSLVDDYRIVLGHYLGKLSRFEPDSQTEENKAHRRLASDAVDKLDKLDELRESVRRKTDGNAVEE